MLDVVGDVGGVVVFVVVFEISVDFISRFAGVKLTINSDDAGVFHTSILDDYSVMISEFGFTAEDFKATNLIGLEASFLPAHEKDAVRRKYFS